MNGGQLLMFMQPIVGKNDNGLKQFIKGSLIRL